MTNRLEDVFYLGNGVEIVPWLHRRDGRAMCALSPITPIQSPYKNIWSHAVRSHAWNRNDDFLDVYVTATATATVTATATATTLSTNSTLLFFPAAPHAIDYIRAHPTWFPDRQTIDTMFQTLQLRALRCITDRWVICDIFCLDGISRLGRTNAGDIRQICTMQRAENAVIPPILIGDLPYGGKTYRMELHYGRPSGCSTTVRMPYASCVEQMVSMVKKAMETIEGEPGTQMVV